MGKNKKKNRTLPIQSNQQVSRPNSHLEAKQIQIQSFKVPLPAPEMLAQYDQIVPGSAEKIIQLWEEQVHHRMNLEQKAISADISQSRLGSILGFVIAMTAIVCGTILAYLGRPTEGIAAIITALGGIIGAYVWGSYQRRKEREGKLETPKQPS